MKFYWVKTHRVMKWLFSEFIWDVPNKDNMVYLTFDDGPTPEITDWVITQLSNYDAKAVFFCIGNNIRENPEIFKRLIDSGHCIGNHTHNHVNGWYLNDLEYITSVSDCEEQLKKYNIATRLFRPPYGKLKRSQAKMLRHQGYKIIMWDILSADFDHKVSPEKCVENVLRNIRPGSIVIFHDSVKAFPNLKYVLPKTLEYIKEKGYKFGVIN